MRNQKNADLGVTKHKGIKNSLNGAIDKKSKAARKREAMEYRDTLCDVLRPLIKKETAVLVDDHEMKNIAIRYGCDLSGFHRLASNIVPGHRGSTDDIIFDIALDPSFNDMTVGKWREMIAKMKECLKTDDVSFSKHVDGNDLFWENFYRKCSTRDGTVSWDQLLWMGANSEIPDTLPKISTIVFGSTDQKNWSPVQHKLFNVLKGKYPDAKVLDIDDEMYE